MDIACSYTTLTFMFHFSFFFDKTSFHEFALYEFKCEVGKVDSRSYKFLDI